MMRTIYYIVFIVIIILFILYIFSFLRTNEFVYVAPSMGDDERISFLKESPGEIAEGLWASVAKGRKKQPPQPVATTTLSTFTETFSANGELEEAGSMTESAHQHWWVNSGAYLYSSGGIGKTIQGELSTFNSWYLKYLWSNPVDTDNGRHPQNIFRLVGRDRWDNYVQQTYFKITGLNVSDSPNRNASNGLFLFNRYQTGDDLYYTGLRVDGAVVIKKKIKGTYYTMAYKPFISGVAYDHDSNPSLLPLNTWIGLKSEITTNVDNSVTIKFYVDMGKTGWVLALEAVDKGSAYGPAPITAAGYAGIRTDFMDVEFDDYSIEAK